MTELDKRVVRAQQGKALVPAYPARRGTRAATASGRKAVAGLTGQERTQVVETFIELLEGLYTHLPLKRAMYAIDPLQRLRLLRQRAEVIGDLELHHQLALTLTGLRDAHTRYLGPTMMKDAVATLPFMVEAYGPADKRRYIVSKVATRSDRISTRSFVPGVELRWWNAVPIDRAVDIYADRETGGRPDARRVRALESLTFRALQYGPPPDEEWVVVGYRDRNGQDREIRFEWRVVMPGRARTAGIPERSARRAYALDPAAETRRRVKKLLFAPELWAGDRRTARRARPVPVPPAGEWWVTDFNDVIGAKTVKTRSGTFGYLRLWSFDLSDDVAFVAEIVRVVSLMPPAGLIIDLRANPGGLIWAAERILQLFTPRPVTVTRFSILATELTRAMADAEQNKEELEPWRESLGDAVANGEPYSRAVPLTPFDVANDIGQAYGGPVVAVVDANTYSSGDLFAAGFHDNDIGTLVCVDEATGGGGANVWEPTDVQRALEGTDFMQKQLPGGISYTLAVRRATRSGAAEGVAIEDVGVRGHVTYAMTQRDLTDNNHDLLAFCGRLLRDQPRSNMTLEWDPNDPEILLVQTRGLDRLDVIVDDRPRSSLDAQNRQRSRISVANGWSTIELRGYADGDLLQSRRLSA